MKADDNAKKVNRRKCRYYNRGFCKDTIKCRYLHPERICQVYLETQSCQEKQCPDRHPKLCKWLKHSGGCKRQNCAYLHCDKGKEETERNNFRTADSFWLGWGACGPGDGIITDLALRFVIGVINSFLQVSKISWFKTSRICVNQNCSWTVHKLSVFLVI